MRITLIVGDKSHDGHGMTESIDVESNLSRAELLEAYSLGCEIVGFDLKKEVAREHQDCSLPEHMALRLREKGYTWEGDDDLDGLKLSDISLYPEWFVDIWMFIASLGNSKLSWSMSTANPIIGIGGYGLFS